MAKGYYSVIQYNPDRSRSEAANVGVVIFVPGTNEPLLVRNSDQLSRVRTFFKPDANRVWQIDDAIKANMNRLLRDQAEYRSLEDFEQYVNTLANDIRMTPPRVIAVNNPADEIERLFRELVENPAQDVARSLKAAKVLPPALNEVFYRLSNAGKIWKPGKVIIPVVKRSIEVPYAYQNGVVNLVMPHVFSGHKRAEQQAASLAIDGDLIKRYPIDGKAHQLVVVSTHEDQKQSNEMTRHVEPLFKEYGVRLIRPQDANAFAQEVEQSAH
jgi:hypothetical protein